MKIIDNKKDYYDYLMGVYGIDEKIVYDRRGSTTYDMLIKALPLGSEKQINERVEEIVLKVGDTVYIFKKNKSTDYKWDLPKEITTGWWKNKTTNENPKKMDVNELMKMNRNWKSHFDKTIVMYLQIPDVNSKAYLCPDGTTEYRNSLKYFIDNPILDGFSMIPKFISPDTIWNNLYDYIAHQYDKTIIDSRTDIQKLESAGFDKKTSFRNM